MAIKWETLVDEGDLMPTQLDGLTDNNLSGASAVFANNTGLDMYGYIEFELDSVTFVAPAYLELYMTKQLNGTNYEDDPVISGTDVNSFIENIPIKAGAAARRVTSRIFLIPPCEVKFFVGSQANVTLNNTTPTNAMNLYTFNAAST